MGGGALVFDVVIIGAGCAGKAALEALRGEGCRVAVVDQRKEVIEELEASDVLCVFCGKAEIVGTGYVEVTGKSGLTRIRGNAIIVAAGRNLEGLGLEGLGVERAPEGFIRVDDRCRSRVPWLFVAGDATGPPFTKEKALEEGRVAGLAALGRPVRVSF